MKKIKDIDFNNKEIVATEYHFYFSQKERPEGWTIEDEIMMLSLYLQKEIVSREAKTPIHTLMDWRQNVSKAINKTLDKLDAENIFANSRIHDLHDYTPWYETYVTKMNFNGNVINIVSADKNANDVLTETGKQQLEKERMLEEAKELAKAELLAEQEQAQKEKEATQKAEDVDIVIPFRNYGK